MNNKNILVFAAVILACSGIWYFFHQIVIYILIAGILSLIGQPIDRFIGKLKIGNFQIPATISAALALLTLFLFFFTLALIFTPLIMEEASFFSSLDRETIMASLQQPMNSIDHLLHNFNIDYRQENLQNYFREKLISVLSITNLSLFANRLFGALGDFFIAFFAISFLTFFFLRDEKIIADGVLSLFPSNYSDKLNLVLTEAERLLKRYFIGILIEVLLVTALLSIGLSIAGIKHALLIALFAGLMNVVPYVGPFIGAAFALLIGLTTNQDAAMLSTVIKICIVFPIVNLADAFLLQPLIYSSSVKAHPVEIFLVILSGAAIGGIGGMILAVPSYTILRVFVKEFFSKKIRPEG